MANTLGKLLYALLFLVCIPAALWFWAASTAPIIRYPALESPITGWFFALLGGLLMAWGMLALRQYGKGLPMNAFPPSEFVVQGPYRWFSHPIYWGFGFFSVGFFILTGSASGLWLVSPVLVLGMTALVWGYERLDLQKRFPGASTRTWLDFPENGPGIPGLIQRLATLFWVFGLLLLLNFTVLFLVGDVRAYAGESTRLTPFWGHVGWLLCAPAATLVSPFFLKNKQTLRYWGRASVLGLALAFFVALVFPEAGAQYLPVRGISGPVTQMLSVPVFLVLISLQALQQQSRRFFLPMVVAAVILCMIQLANSRSPLLHLSSSLAIFLLAGSHQQVWQLLKNGSEKIANSWQEWVFGRVRVINHAFYIFFGTFLAILMAGALAGVTYAWAILVFTVIGIVFAALWAQIIEGSEKLKRPFGYYGSLVSIPFGSLAVWIMGADVWVIIAVIAVAMPWAQAIGRLRCLVNGCCHGAPVDNPDIGIRYVHHRSRVCNISHLKGALLHPTQLYAIIWLFFLGFILLALWMHQFPASFIAGIYLILSGLGRFVEEAYRGEVQTRILGGLRLYQWVAIVTVVLGMLFTGYPTAAVMTVPGFGWETLVAATLGGLFAGFAMGVDFPYSNARFSRLV